MIKILIPLVFFIAGIISGTYHMNEEISLDNKIFKKVNLKKNYRKLFIFKDKQNVFIVALIGQILGYIILVVGIFLGIFINLQSDYDKEHLYHYFLEKLLIVSGSVLIYILACVLIHKISIYVIKSR